MSDPATPHRSRESTRAAWAERLTRFESSGQSVLDFCKAESLSPQSFYYWRRKLAGPDATPSVPEFLPVRISPAPAAPVEIALPGGATLRLSPGCDLAFVRSLVEALAGGGGPC